MLAPPPPASGGTLRPSGRLWAYDALGGAAGPLVRVWDLAGDAIVTSFAPRPGIGRGIAYDPTDGTVWTSTLNGLPGDGFIHKNPALGGPDLTTIPDPGGVGGPGIGALDYDAEDDVLWAAAYQPVAGMSLIYKLDPGTGAVLATCSVPYAGGPVGNDTLAVARPSDLGGAKVLLTDAGEELTSLLAIDPATCAVVKTYRLPIGVTGIDVLDSTGEMIAASLSGNGLFYNLGPAPYDAVLAAMFTQGNVEDIAVVEAPPCLLRTAAVSFPPLTPPRTGSWVYATMCGTGQVLTDPAPRPAAEGDLAEAFAGPGGVLRLYQVDCTLPCPPRIGVLKDHATGRTALKYLP